MNRLLVWMSVLGQGSWQQFRNAVGRFCFDEDQSDGETAEEMASGGIPVHHRAKFAMQRLAHAEFYASTADSDWRIVPASLATFKVESGWLAICCGARSPDLAHVIREHDFGVSVKSTQNEMAPDSICLQASKLAELESIARTFGFIVQVDSPRALLAAIPPVDDPRSRYLNEAPAGAGWKIDRFLPTALQWTSKTNDRELGISDFNRTSTGLFRFRLKHQQFYFLKWNQRTYRTNVQVGKFAVIRRERIRNLLDFDRSTCEFSVPLTCRPPLFIERALILCTGRLPRVDAATNRLVYEGIPNDVARIAGALLRQEVNLR